jgi:hypothetical protein
MEMRSESSEAVDGSRAFDADGLWTLFPRYQLASGEYCPDEWRAFQVLVRG